MAIIDIVCVLLLICGLFLVVRFVMNEIFLRRYDRKVYSTKYEEPLLVMNFPDSYLPYYNLGNVAYQNGDYDEAISNYKKALEIGQNDFVIFSFGGSQGAGRLNREMIHVIESHKDDRNFSISGL